MKKAVLWLVVLLVGVAFCMPGPNAWAGERKAMPGVGWYYPYKDSFAEWKPPKEEYDPRMFNQDVIESYGYEAKDVEAIKDLLPEHLYVMLKDPQTWGKIRINVTERKPIQGPVWDQFKAATEQYKGQPKLGAEGWIQDYKAGTPFPTPKSGLELEWNFKKAFWPDDRVFPVMLFITNDKHQVRYQTTTGDLMFFNHRLMVDPKPLYEPNPDDLDRIDAYAAQHPYELQGTISLIKQFDSPDKDDELWMYLPAMRRVRHLSTAQRTDKLPGGQDLFWDCFDTLNVNPKMFTFKSLGQKPILAVANGAPKGEFIEGEYLMGPNDYYQKINCWVNEVKPKDPNYPFSKILHYLDPETWMPFYSVWYDEKGQLKRATDFHYTLTKNGFFMPNVMNHIDIQAVHSTGYAFTNALAKGNTYNIGLTTDYFLLDNLRTVYPAR